MSKHVRLPSSVGELEAIFTESAGARSGIVICHPHPQYGGSMHDGVVGTVESVAQRSGFTTLKFNFRGVGASAGRYDDGTGEIDDALAAATWLRERIGAKPLWLAGYSFGSNVVWRALSRAGEVAGVLLIAPPVGLMDFSARPGVNVSVIAGDADDFVDGTELGRWGRALNPPARIDFIEGADHFFPGGYSKLARAAEYALAGALR
jgi:alpha/beta superfamily hydrolase